MSTTYDESLEIAHEECFDHLCELCDVIVVEHIHLSPREVRRCEEENHFRCPEHELKTNLPPFGCDDDDITW